MKRLLGTVERKTAGNLPNGLARQPDGVQHLLERAQWDADAARDVLRQYAVERLGERDAVLIVTKRVSSRKVSTRPACNANTAAGAKGERLYDWAMMPLWRLQITAEELRFGHYLLVRRSLDEKREHAYYVVYAPRSKASLQILVNVAGRRWEIETGFEATKGECGLDQYEVRRWRGWYRHITLALPAHAVLVTLRIQGKKTPEGMIPLSPQEIRRLLCRLLWRAVHPINRVISWSIWRRTHQWRAQQSHYRRRVFTPPVS